MAKLRYRKVKETGICTMLFRQGVLFSLALCVGCASGRSLTMEETQEFEALRIEKANLSTVATNTKKQIQATVKGISTDAKGRNALLCGSDAKTLKSGKVPLVYATKKRVIFKRIGKTDRRGCQKLNVEVRP